MNDVELAAMSLKKGKGVGLMELKWEAGLRSVIYAYYLKSSAMISNRASSCATEQIKQPGHNGSLVAESAFFGLLYATLSHVPTPNR